MDDVTDERGAVTAPPPKSGPTSTVGPGPGGLGGTKAVGGLHLAEWACELFGTALLVLGGLSAVTADFTPGSPVASLVPSASARLLLTGLLFASCGALVTISPLGRRSGAHLNPAVTVAFWLGRHIHPQDLLGYCVAQCLGACLGAGVLLLLWGGRAAAVGDGVTRPGHGLSPWEAAGVEAAMTAMLVFVIFAFLSSSRTARWTPLAVLATVALLVWQGAPYTGTSLNPARSLGPAIVADHFVHLWVYVVGPLGGALLAAAVWRVVPRETLTAKLFHDPRYRSVVASALPARQG